MTAPVTYWNGQTCIARRCVVIIGEPPSPTWWMAHLVGEEWEAVEVISPLLDGGPFYLANEDGQGWAKVLTGGGPRQPHRSVPVSKVVRYLDEP